MLPTELRHDGDLKPRSRLTKRGRALLLLAIAVPVVILLVVGGVAIGHRFQGGGTADYSGTGTGQVVVEVKAGASTTAIGQALAKADVVKSAGAFVNAAKTDNRASTIEPGFYQLKKQMSGASALALIVNRASLVQTKFTIPEGTSIKSALPIIARDAKVTLADLQAAVAAPTTLGLPAYANGNVEGFLFPATYQVRPNSTATDVLRAMVARFGTAATNVDLVNGSEALGYSPLQVVIIASIIERESASPQDAAKVARVFYNRLKVGMPLGSEFTVNYAGNDAKSPYNTYTHTGFPPGPYDSPGEATLKAALHPEAGPWLYFVTLKAGTQFVTTEAQFNTLTQQCRAEGGCK